MCPYWFPTESEERCRPFLQWPILQDTNKKMNKKSKLFFLLDGCCWHEDHTNQNNIACWFKSLVTIILWKISTDLDVSQHKHSYLDDKNERNSANYHYAWLKQVHTKQILSAYCWLRFLLNLPTQWGLLLIYECMIPWKFLLIGWIPRIFNDQPSKVLY